MKNLSGDCSGWTGSPRQKKEKSNIVEEMVREKIKLDLTPEIKELRMIKDKLEEKYKLSPDKKILDALINLDSCIRSLNI